jgi:3-hydroxyacyl-[acyl-carrier-protein] dehydratase
MRFVLYDEVLEQEADRIVVIKQVTAAEEYLADHFPGFPVLPGVLMVEALTQAARRMLRDRSERPMVLGTVKGLRFGSMVRPGQALEVEVTLQKELPEGEFSCRGVGRVRRHDHKDAGETAVSGRFTMRPIRDRSTA